MGKNKLPEFGSSFRCSCNGFSTEYNHKDFLTHLSQVHQLHKAEDRAGLPFYRG